MSSHDTWVLQINPAVFKSLKSFPKNDKFFIFETIGLLSKNPYFGDIQKMKSEHDAWRRRVGAYRIFYRIKTNIKIILVFKVERRTSTTY